MTNLPTRIEEVRDLSGQNVIATIGAQVTELKARLSEFQAETWAELKSQGARIDIL